MSVGPAFCRAEIFRQPVFFDDSFAKGWTLTTGGSSAFQSDGEIAILDAGDQSMGDIEKSIGSIVVTTPVEWRVIARTTQIQGSAEVWVYDTNQALWVKILTITSDGLSQSSMASVPAGNTINKIRLRAVGQYNMEKFEYVVLSKTAMLVPDSGDLVEDLTVTLPLLNNAINSTKLLIFNSGGAYNGLINPHDVILLWLARDSANLGVPDYKVFGGRIVKPTNTAEKYGANYIMLEAHGHAYETNIPPNLMPPETVYSGTNGRTIIEDALNLCNYISKHADPTKWFDSGGSSGSTDDRINSTHNVSYDEETPLIVIQEILEKAKNPSGVQGFVVYEAPSGVLVGHLRDSLDFASPISSITPFGYKNGSDLHPSRNKVKVYGAFGAGNQTPTDENWTENLTEWIADIGTLSLVAALEAGSYAVKCLSASYGAGYSCSFRRSFRPERGYISGVKETSLNSFGKLYFYWSYYGTPITNSCEVRLLAPDSSNYFYKVLGTVGSQSHTLGDSGGWSSYGTPAWDNIQQVQFVGSSTSSGFILYVDNLRLKEGRCYAVVENATSKGLYNTRMEKPITDNLLATDSECQARGESILATQKDPIITLEDVEVDGDHRYKPGDRQRIVVAADGLDAYFPIAQVQHRLRQSVWDNVLNLSTQPQLIDYVFKLLKDKQDLLERTL